MSWSLLVICGGISESDREKLSSEIRIHKSSLVHYIIIQGNIMHFRFNYYIMRDTRLTNG